MSEVKAMLARSPSLPPAFRLNLQRPKPLLVQFLRLIRPAKILAFDSEGSAYFDCTADNIARSDDRQALNWPLSGQQADLERDLRLRDELFARHIDIIRQGYLARQHASPLGNGDVVHIDGDYAFQQFIANVMSDGQHNATWVLLENIHTPLSNISNYEQKFADVALGVSIWERTNSNTFLDFGDLALNLYAAVNRLMHENGLQATKELEARLAYNILREIQYEDSTLLDRLRKSLYLHFMYGSAKLLGHIAPKRQEKLLRSARKRDPQVNDHRFINKIIRSYPQRLQLQERLIKALIAEGIQYNVPSLSVIIDMRSGEIDQMPENFLSFKFVKNAQIIILRNPEGPSYDTPNQIGNGNSILILNMSPETDSDTAAAVAIAQCTGDYVLITDPQYIYHPYLLAAVQRHLASYKEALVLYTDEDKIDLNGQRSSPKYKPDFNRDLFYNNNYLGAPVFVERKVLQSLAKDNYVDRQTLLYAATLTALERGGDAAIQHLDMVLASRKAAKPPLKANNCKTLLKDHLARQGHTAVQLIDGHADDACLLDWALEATNRPFVSIIIPTFNQLDLTQNAVKSILAKSRYRNFEILLVDNNSDDPDMLAWLAILPTQDSRVRVLRDERPFNFSAINNAAFCHAGGDIIALVNNDIEIISDVWLEELVAQAVRPDIGCVGAKLLYPNGKIQHAGINIDLVGDMHHLMRMYPSTDSGYMRRLHMQQNYLAVTGACLFVKRALYAAVGGLNQIELPIGCSDIDICLKVQALGFRNLWSPRATLIHHESISRGLDISAEKRERAAREHAFMRARWKMQGEKDPFYNAAIDT